jgi:TetR/AcrR family transcriptional regulator, repressor for uid operon
MNANPAKGGPRARGVRPTAPARPKGPAARPLPARKAAPAADQAAAPGRAELAELRRRQILDAAEECFRLHGFHNASMAEIARTFGMSAGHIYNYFDSKEAIIAGIVERDVEEFMRRAEELRGVADVHKAILERVDAGIEDKLNVSKSARQFEVLAEAGRNPKVLATLRAADARVRDTLRDLLCRGPAGDHRDRERDLEARVALLMALFDGLMVRGLRQPELNRVQLTRVLRAVMAGLLR